MMELMIRHTVEDFARWKVAFDEDKSARVDAGLTDERVWQNADNPNEVVVLMKVADVHSAQMFANSADLRETMQAAGVIGRPEATFLTSG